MTGARLLYAAAAAILLLVSLSAILMTELYRLRSHREQISKELSILQESLLSFSSTATAAGTYGLPPLATILDSNRNVIGDPQVLLQFAVVGFGKCGTSSLMHWLETHPELQMLTSEVWALTGRDPARLITRLHKKLKAPNLARGYKCPGDILAQYVMNYYRKYWPQTKLFVGIRHPVLWFQSLYNFRVQNFKNFEAFPHPNLLTGSCDNEWALMCMGRGFFGFHLLRLGKQHWNGTRETTALEYRIMEWMGFGNHTKTDLRTIDPQPNDIFLFEIQQLSDENRTRHDQFKRDIQSYLNLTKLLPDMVHFRPGMDWHDALQKKKDAKKIDICEDQYIPARQILMEISRMSSQWIRSEFLQIPSVFVSSEDHVRRILATEWMVDPCGTKSDLTSVDEVGRIIFETTGQDLDELNKLTRRRTKAFA